MGIWGEGLKESTKTQNNGITKNGTYISKRMKREVERDKNKIVVVGNPKRTKTGEFKQEFPNQRERRKSPHTFQPNRLTEKHEQNIAEFRQQVMWNRESQKHLGRWIRKPKKLKK